MTDSDCLFCERKKLDIVFENKLAAAFYDLHPVNEGHLLIIPKIHRDNYFELTEKELLAINKLLQQGKQLLERKFSPDGYNIGVNIGEYGGQTVMHCHFHLIPRYIGDDLHPAG